MVLNNLKAIIKEKLDVEAQTYYSNIGRLNNSVDLKNVFEDMESALNQSIEEERPTTRLH
jgi:flagellar motor switch protein FliG